MYRNDGQGVSRTWPKNWVLRDPAEFPGLVLGLQQRGALDCTWPATARGWRRLPGTTWDSHQSESDALYLGDGRGGFREVSAEFGLVRVTQPMGCNFGDLDNDGWPDFYLGAGYPGYAGIMPNLLFHNQGGKRFADVTFAAGFGHLQKGHGVSLADFDHDGDLDVFQQIGGWYPGDAFGNALFENPRL
ncbi:MAG: hypothetical protein Ct9H300mP1_27430 [Planctomycetaceae bacterium]|nr:MAG: hypothetical protein Ct9H300mP1_27430 [Planctomycetaceae bacterium]